MDGLQRGRRIIYHPITKFQEANEIYNEEVRWSYSQQPNNFGARLAAPESDDMTPDTFVK